MEDIVKHRLQVILEKNGCNPTQFAKAYKLNQKTVNNQINSTTQLSASIILLMLDMFPEVSAEWLLRGKGEMFLKEESRESAVPSQQSESEDVQFMRERIISLESENRVLREMLGLQRDSKQHVDEKIAL
jgi:plasmid maintenance system antidote protein VapI|nr:MAG TPA: SOS-response transcriptional repressor [Bacteriophage sp.]